MEQHPDFAQQQGPSEKHLEEESAEPSEECLAEE
jgi:hypothetical protein